MKCFFVLILFATQALAQPVEQKVPDTLEPAVEKTKEVAKEIREEVRDSAYKRENSSNTLLLGYEVLSTWLPFKWTASYSYNFNKKWSLEAEYGRGHFGAGLFGFEVASVTENRYSLLARRFVGNSFHFIFGLYKNDFRAKIGSDMLDDMSDTSIDDFNVNVVGAAFGIGNRWSWQNGFTLGIDWFRIHAPVFDRKTDSDILGNVDDDNDRSSLRDSINRLESIPTFTLLGINLGYTF